VTLFYRDISHYDGPVSMAGQPLVIAKATQGTSYTDPTYAGHKASAAQAGVPFGAYHWVDTSDLAAQARHAHDVIGSVPTMWDAEADGATVARLLELTSRFRALGGVVHLVYLPHWWWQHIGSPDLRPVAGAGLALVSSNYTSYSDTGPGWTAYGGVAPAAWQYTSTPHDINAYRGTVAQLWTLMTGVHQAEGEDDMALRDDIDGRWMYPRIESIAHMADTITDPHSPEAGQPVPFVTALREIRANAAKAAAGVPVALSAADRQAIVDAVAAQVGAKLDEVLARLAAAGQALDG